MNSSAQFIFVGLLLFLTNVISKSIPVDCGVALVQDETNNQSMSIPLSQILGKDLITFTSNYTYWKITNITVNPGQLFRLCATNFCRTFDAKTKTVDEKLQDIGIDTISANCTNTKQTNPDTTCAQLSEEMLKKKECVRFYRGKSCSESFPYEIGKENKSVSFGDEIFESLAVRTNCRVIINSDLQQKIVTFQDDLFFPIYKDFQYPRPKGINFTCIC